MKKQHLEERVASLEKKVAELESSLNGGDQKDWRRTFGMFTGDEGMKRVDEEARKSENEIDKKHDDGSRSVYDRACPRSC